jgi:xanthine/CO dehydrogenase XdhC/CoxF family maturation factor
MAFAEHGSDPPPEIAMMPSQRRSASRASSLRQATVTSNRLARAAVILTYIRALIAW